MRHGWLSLSDEDFAAEAEAAMGGFLGKVTMLAPRLSFPLGFHHAAQITARRLALVGDAAHAIHPIAGQGLNLGFRDVAALAQVVVEAPASDSISGTTNCSTAISAGARLTRSRSPSPRTL